ncbi:hypothetical protein KAZ01_03970, partial [Candidatus Gracilibacteria bacterium]|nr:hypothetical protein [Candidatus Gracilibacteria bacterium]
MKNIIIENKRFEHVKTRLHSSVSIYKGPDCYMRIGPIDLIKKELLTHSKLLEYNFSIAKILKEGEKDNQYFYIEESLGNEVLGVSFCKDFNEKNVLSKKEFDKFMNITKDFTKTQIGTIGKAQISTIDFFHGIQLDTLFNEKPNLKKEVTTAFEKIKNRLIHFPEVFTQGDFNPHNFFSKGIIDFDSSFSAPIGYDQITAIFHTYSFPNQGIAEISRGYVFSEEQEKYYLDSINEIFINEGLPKLSNFIDDFLFVRLVWSVV